MPSYTYQALSELEAVNLMLATIGESPVSTLSTTGDLHVSVATQMLYDTSRIVQTGEWNFNSETNYPLVRDTDGFIAVPSNALSVDLTADYPDYDVVVRNNRLYDRKAHSFVFTADVKVEVSFFLPWTDLPQAARQYIAIHASRVFQRRMQGDAQINKESEEEERLAKAALDDYDASVRDYNLGDNYDVFTIIGDR